MKLTLALAERISAATTEGPSAMQALRAELQAEARDPATSALKRKLLLAADDRLREAEEAQAAVTDPDRLERAFDALNERGIVAPMEAGDTLADGLAEVAAARGEADRGAVFYHAQDVERAAVGEGLGLAFLAFAGGAEATVQIGQEVAAVLAEHGLEVAWDGQADTRLHLPSFIPEPERAERPRSCGLAILACALEHRIRVIKACRDLLGLSLAEARSGLDSLQPLRWRWDTSPPWIAARGLARADAERIAAELQAAGAEVQLY